MPTMTPPKITRPVEPEVQHTFPAWYLHYDTNTTWLAVSANYAVCPENRKLSYGDLPEVREAHAWERLPSGSKIEFTQP